MFNKYYLKNVKWLLGAVPLLVGLNCLGQEASKVPENDSGKKGVTVVLKEDPAVAQKRALEEQKMQKHATIQPVSLVAPKAETPATKVTDPKAAKAAAQAERNAVQDASNQAKLEEDMAKLRAKYPTLSNENLVEKRRQLIESVNSHPKK